jgi:hypothetical protein
VAQGAAEIKTAQRLDPKTKLYGENLDCLGHRLNQCTLVP